LKARLKRAHSEADPFDPFKTLTGLS